MQKQQEKKQSKIQKTKLNEQKLHSIVVALSSDHELKRWPMIQADSVAYREFQFNFII